MDALGPTTALLIFPIPDAHPSHPSVALVQRPWRPECQRQRSSIHGLRAGAGIKAVRGYQYLSQGTASPAKSGGPGILENGPDRSHSWQKGRCCIGA